ncbi:Sigma-24 (FecI) [Rhodospirillum rubrum ATCC 11170]|uniref:RNA polymerase sigma factor n=2 Tax=Rhodospirillum rubrum TaxID=1085 RepID=Q2RWG9_RHORT|nr:sigma-70 family RNA polymerase sigma factor [Rhodospirillum rubrum]ABC21526.1 Sigma-24 (FecI) [Rhodospirillum rubrum ATCC 11170]MBK5953123.1 RNA polymerase subunit sigma [Rhodospirillum rubrum]QXG81199.1 sigma-70 family RNA polymerase sigma factor [Rhodospirillum rubrum]
MPSPTAPGSTATPASPAPPPSPAADGADHGALIVAIARSGDRAAFATLFTHYAPRLKSYLRRLGANDASAEEVAQEALLMVWRKAERFDPTKAGAATWIFTIARNLRIDMLRKERRPEIDPEDPLLEPSSPDAADILIEKDQRETRVRTALRSLPADQAEVVRLAFFEDLTHVEVADRLGLPLGTVKSRLRLAFSKVRGSVGDEVR